MEIWDLFSREANGRGPEFEDKGVEKGVWLKTEINLMLHQECFKLHTATPKIDNSIFSF